MRWRYICAFCFFMLSFIAIVGKLYFWQIIDAEELSTLGQAQYTQQLTLQPQRGEIQTSDGFPIAANRISYRVFANPKAVIDQKKTADQLSPILQEDTATISGLLAADKYWISLKTQLDTKDKEKIDNLHLPGIGFEEEYGRFYPEASMAAQLLGFVGKDNFGSNKGYFGLEGYYDRQLLGRAGKAVIIHDALGRPVLTKLTNDAGQQDGRTLVLHIDRTVQYLVEQKLKDGIQKYGAQSGMAAIMDPHTGSIIAMSSFPAFDPRTYTDFDTSLYINPFITATYEPGSTFKPLVMSAALDAGLITPTTTCTICGGPVSIGGYDIHTWNDKYYENINMIDVMQHSDNTGMIFVSQKLGLDRMYRALQDFGIGESTKIDLEGELAPKLKPKDSWYAIDLATVAFGQGLAVTPIELLDAFSTIANGGARMEPQIVSQIITPDGQTISIPPKELSHPISSTTANVMKEILVNAVNKGEASFARIKGYRIAGKTGTASIPVSGHYDPTKTIASFIGFAPADNPKFIMLVILNRPSTSIYGAETAAPIFFDISKDLLSYYGIAPSGNDQ